MQLPKHWGEEARRPKVLTSSGRGLSPRPHQPLFPQIGPTAAQGGMKPTTAYQGRKILMQDWEKTLELLGQNGWSYAYVKCIDLEMGTDTYYVSIRRGEERLISLRPTLAEAVGAVSRLVEAGAA